MKYFSEITKKTYDTIEELQAEETSIKEQMTAKVEGKIEETEQAPISTAASERKEAAKRVEFAFENVSKLKKANSSIRDSLEQKIQEIELKYQKLHMELEEGQRNEMFDIEKQFKEIDRGENEAVERAYSELREFCKKHGSYHYSVNAGDSNIFPMLMGFGQIEKMNGLFTELFRNFMF